MKNQIQKSEIRNPFQKIENELIAYAKLEGQQHALNNEPKTEHNFKATICNYIQSTIQREIDQSNHELTPISGRVNANQKANLTTIRIDELQRIKNDKVHESMRLKTMVDECSISKNEILKRNFARVVLFLLAISEGYFIYQACIASTIAIIPSIIIGAAIALGIFLITGMIARYYKSAKTIIQLRIKIVSTMCLILLFFYIVGMLRVQGIANTMKLDDELIGSSSNSSGISAIMLAILSTCIFVAGLLITMKYQLSEEDKKNRRIYLESRKKLNLCRIEIAQIENEINHIAKESNEVSTNALVNYEEAVHREKMLIAISRKALQEYIQSNLRFRKDGITPLFFQHTPILEFNLFVNNIKNTTIQ